MDLSSISMYTIALLVVAVSTLFFYLHRISTTWKRKGVPSYGNIISGCFSDNIRLKRSLADVVYDLYMQTRRKHKLVGTFMFGRPILILNDPEIITKVLVSDFGNFNSRGVYYDTKHDALSGSLFSLDGHEWKNMRSKMAPIFSSGKIKTMFNTLMGCINKLDTIFDKEKPKIIDTRFVMSSLSIDVIATIAFGIEANCIENADAEFGTIGRSFNDPSFKDFVKFYIFSNVHWLAKVLRLKFTSESHDTFFKTIVRETVSHREINNVTRNDFMDLMIRLKNSGKIEGSLTQSTGGPKGMTLDEIAAQAFVFVIAGFETTSQANTMALLEMAKHHDVQRRVQDECDKVLKQTNGEITYDAVNTEMPYTEQVLNETMRLYTALQVLLRCALKKCKIPLTDLEVEKGTLLFIPFAALQRDPDFFPEPDKFDPDRFSEENKAASPPTGAFIPFGDGPRMCIGKRFAMIQMKALMLYLLSKYDIDVVEDTELTVDLNPKCFFPNPMGKFYLKFSPRGKRVP